MSGRVTNRCQLRRIPATVGAPPLHTVARLSSRAPFRSETHSHTLRHFCSRNIDTRAAEREACAARVLVVTPRLLRCLFLCISLFSSRRPPCFALRCQTVGLASLQSWSGTRCSGQIVNQIVFFCGGGSWRASLWWVEIADRCTLHADEQKSSRTRPLVGQTSGMLSQVPCKCPEAMSGASVTSVERRTLSARRRPRQMQRP